MPQPTDAKSIGFPFVELQSVDSTNNYARQQIHAGLAHHGTVFFAHEQLAGKGQRGKGWVSERGANIMQSIVINPYPLAVTQQFTLSACVAVAIQDFFRKYAGLDTRIKWPNDLYWQDRKAGGVLIESGVRSWESIADSPQSTVHSRQSAVDGSMPGSAIWEWCIVGIGININQTVFSAVLPNPVSLKQITGKVFNVVELAKELCGYVDKYFRKLKEGDSAGIIKQYNDYLYRKDLPVKLKKGSRVLEAIVKSVSVSGKLVVQHSIEEEFDFGEVEWLIK